MSPLVVRTRQSFPCPAATVWSLLCNSRMEGRSTLLFRLGVPQPIACRLADGVGGVGGERECISDQGVVHQRILEWSPDQRLAFRMETTNMEFQRFVREIGDTFELVPAGRATVVTRTTTVQTAGGIHPLRTIGLRIGLKHVHRYVFRNWRRLALTSATPAGASESGVPSTPSH
jgi:Polyketide cyclase / dehydrase and lipid transport